MNQNSILKKASLFLLFLLSTQLLHAEEAASANTPVIAVTTNVIKTELDAFEAQPGTVIIRNTGQIGVVNTERGSINIACKESVEAATNRKMYGMAITVTVQGGLTDTSIIDYAEMESLVSSLGYLANVNWSVASMDSFDAVYTSRDGLIISVHSSNRQAGVINAALTSDHAHWERISLTPQQFSQLKLLVQQAKTKLDTMRGSK